MVLLIHLRDRSDSLILGRVLFIYGRPVLGGRKVEIVGGGGIFTPLQVVCSAFFLLVRHSYVLQLCLVCASLKS